MRLIIIAVALSFVGAGAGAHEIVHMAHGHAHGDACGHAAIAHDGHIDYLHDGHLHAVHGGHMDEHAIAVSVENPASEVLVTQVSDHDHQHGADDEVHLIVQHGDHFDFIHDARLHHVHNGHVDDHGPVKLVKKS